MKHLLTILAVAALTSAAAFAADSSAPALEYGVHGGLNFGTMSNAASGVGSETGVVAGLVAQYPLMDYLAIQPELNFIQKGAGSSAETIKLNYLELPVLLKGQYNLGGVKPFVEAGPKIGLLLSASDTTGLITKSDFNSIDFGFDFGLGVSVPVAENVDVYVEGRYAVGVTNINATAGASTTNNGFQVQVGLLF